MDINTEKAEIFTLENFLTRDQCEYLISKIDEVARRSTVAAGNGEPTSISDYRTSYTGSLSTEDEGIRNIDLQIHNELRIPAPLGEAIQGQRYQVGQQFKDHTDFFEGADYEVHCKDTGNRTWTFMIYLNDDGLVGGETDFPKLGLKFKPKQGTAVVWRNTKDGIPNYDTLHAGRPVIEGTKYIITKWFRERANTSSAVNASINKEVRSFSSHEDIPKATPQGFKVVRIPTHTWNLITEAYTLIKPHKRPEHKDWVLENKDGLNPTDIYPFELLPEIRRRIHEDLRPIHEEWCGEELEPTFIYGIRSYRKGSTLAAHRDRIETHHISTIMIVDKPNDTGSDWPLDIQAHDGTWHKVYANVGDMIMYESATCEHARLEENPHEYFNNFFTHYKYKNYTYAEK